jgi:hypothetical protein
MHRSTQQTTTPPEYKRGQETLNRWLEEIHNNGKATET